MGNKLAAILVALLAWRFFAAQDAGLGLSVDEAQYFLWSLEPAWGYFSKPPLIAWTIALATKVCGDSETCIRLPALILFAATAWIIALIAHRLFDEKTGLWAGIAFATLFLTSFYSWFMTTDSLLLFLWASSLLLFLRALETDRWRDWLMLSAAVGLGLLAKYSMGLFMMCALAVLWIDHRPRLAGPKPWIAVLLALTFLVPNLAWNLDHQFATLRHTAEISQLDRKLFHPDSFLYFAAAQFAVMGPLLLPALIRAAADRRTWRSDPRQRLLVLFSVPVLGLFLMLSLLSRANANWAAPAYVAATVLAAAWLAREGRRRWFAAAVAINLLMAATLYHWHRIAPAIGIELGRRTDPFDRLRGWDAAGRQLAGPLRETGCRAVAAGDRTAIVELAYYGRRALGEPVAPLAWNPSGIVRNHFELTADVSRLKSGCAILVGGFDGENLRRGFAQVEPLPPLTVPFEGRPQPMPAWRVAGFRSYEGAGR
ncbi:MAG: glycosyltransferase family 39 protein [Candidatus Nitricoxidivorans perseverans]|uniref:Glycosyltransferase family 39 protein n=1 Tax=Candidatus Nitricoxidivorans perseverans TaxID=2975601 RepID=A0AA49FJX1_9PROT|nr:MAG: glycosyltransferase family 39 protein [Candidatus Nitricoxidivorans perseverans]